MHYITKQILITKKVRGFLFALSFPFPIVTGIIFSVKYKKCAKDLINIVLIFAISITTILGANITYKYLFGEKYYSKDGTVSYKNYEMTFKDANGNVYTYDFDKSGYDYLYINDTNERLNSDLCYINCDGYLIYDKDMSIIAKDTTHCVDENGSIYYPARYTTFNKYGTIEYSFNSSNFHYDRLGNAYTYDNVPYYDKDGNKYFYTFDSFSQKGYYTNINSGETFDNEYSFVDEDGYFVYDKSYDFVKQNANHNEIYKNFDGKTYYWASSVFWDENGALQH